MRGWQVPVSVSTKKLSGTSRFPDRTRTQQCTLKPWSLSGLGFSNSYSEYIKTNNSIHLQNENYFVLNTKTYYTACVSSRSNMRSAGLTERHCSPIMPMGWLQAHKDREKSHNKKCINLQYSVFMEKISNHDLAILTRQSLGQYSMALVWDFPVKTSLSCKKWLINFIINLT